MLRTKPTKIDYIDLCISNILNEKARLMLEVDWLEYKIEKLKEIKREELAKRNFTDSDEDLENDVPM